MIDDLSTPILATYPPGFEDDSKKSKTNRNGNGDSTATKRSNVLKELGNKLAALAVKRNIAVGPVEERSELDTCTESTHDKGCFRK